MESLFVRSLALPAAQQAQCLTSASRTPADGTFAVASATEGVIRVYAASCAALLHEFASIHKRIYALHYTSFSDSLVTLESDAAVSTSAEDDSDDVETFLCVYHDWRERQIVRGYTLPLGVLERPSSRRKADCVAVCSFTGRVVVAMGSVLNIWQCSRGFFEHVLELQVDMAQPHAFLQVEFVAIHGVYVAFASQTEVRVMEIHVRSSKDGDAAASSASTAASTNSLVRPTDATDPHMPTPPPDESDCVTITSLHDLQSFEDVPVPCPTYSDANDDNILEQQQRLFDEEVTPPAPVVLARNEAQQEAWNLAGLVKSQDLRVNRALAYAVSDSDVHVLLQRFVPPSHAVQSLTFLPETIDNQVSVEARSYTRLLVATPRFAFVYYFLSQAADATRKHMARKVFGTTDGDDDSDSSAKTLQRSKSRGAYAPINVGATGSRAPDALTGQEDTEATATSESGRVVMVYAFSSPVACIAANSSFLFVATLAGLQVWSIWSPCHFVAARRALRESPLVPQPAQPQLLWTQSTPFAVAQIAALDAYVVLLPQTSVEASVEASFDYMRFSSLAAVDRLPSDAFELRRSATIRKQASTQSQQPRSVVIFQQSPPSRIFSFVRQAIASSNSPIASSQIDLLLSLFSLYRYRADVNRDVLHLHRLDDTDDPTDATTTAAATLDTKETRALELETTLYDAIAKACATDLATIFTTPPHVNLARAALLFVASDVESSDVLQRFEAITTPANRVEVIDATSKYLEAFVFPATESLPTLESLVMDNSSIQDQRSGFTRTVLLHYGAYAPEQLARLIIDASLVWSLHDSAFALAKLLHTPRQSALVRVATLVLVLRASSVAADAWTVAETIDKDAADKEATDRMQQLRLLCASDAIASRVATLLRDHSDALVTVSATHPELLVCVAASANRLAPSAFAHVLQTTAPRVLLEILERVFTNAVRRQDAVLASLLFCLRVVGGDRADASIARMLQSTRNGSLSIQQQQQQLQHTTNSDASPAFTRAQCLVLRLLVFALTMFPLLEQLVEKDELHEDELELQRVKAAIGLEMMALSVALSAVVTRQLDDKDASDVAATLLLLFQSDARDASDSVGALLPQWVHAYVDARCLPSSSLPKAAAASVEWRRVVRFLFVLTLELLQEKALIAPAAIVQHFAIENKKPRRKKSDGTTTTTTTTTHWRLENDFAALVVLLTLPRLSRTVDGLQLIATRPDFVNLFLPYGTCYCETLAEWRFLIETLAVTSSSSTDRSPEDESSLENESAILESVLNHICLTLGPDELLQVLPDDGDLSLYMATIEASVRLAETRAVAS